jgi:DNA invertase Pin-like site-specific DNA recombinase
MNGKHKIQRQHLDRLAIVYVRQSHPQQQKKHPESVTAQRRMCERLAQWGWEQKRIRVLEGDLGKSGTTTEGRDDYAWLVSEVTLGHIGIVAGFQINRLAREDETICRLIKSCRVFDTLLADLDGVYHPQDFNDRLVLTVKGLVGGVELHYIQQRMQKSRLERAQRGEWMGPTPMGYVLGEDNKLALDPDEQVQHAVRLVFRQFHQLGSVSAVLRYFHEHQLCLPVRTTSSLASKIEWRSPHRETVRNLLRHPAYAGAYTWGRRPVDPRKAKPGRRGTGRVVLAPQDCQVFLRDNHPAYIDWESFQRNVTRLTTHRRHGPQPSAAREEVSLLAGRVVCGHCGAKMQPHYSPRLRYECARRRLDYGEPACGSLSGEAIERLVSEQILFAIEPVNLQLSLAACEQIESERAELSRHWKLRLERAEQDAARAFRQYDAVEPENRLVARTLERKWEERLDALRSLQEEYDRFCASQAVTLSSSERASIAALSAKLPKLWSHSSLPVAAKRRVVQLLLERVVVSSSIHEQVELELHWSGGTVTRHETTRTVRRWTDLSTYDAIVGHIASLRSQGKKSGEIAAWLNAQGYRTCRRGAFTSDNVRQLQKRRSSFPKGS